ncbi:hypothetical protein KR018_011798, partial [Drosophila ironensis]
SKGMHAVTDAPAWRLWCRLCAKDHPRNRSIYCPETDEPSWTSMLAMAIGKYFWVDIKLQDELSNHLCPECFTLMECLIEFSERVRRVQTLFNRLANAKPGVPLDFEELRTDCGLMTDEWKHVMSRAAEQPQPQQQPQPADPGPEPLKLEEVVAEMEVETTPDFIEEETVEEEEEEEAEEDEEDEEDPGEDDFRMQAEIIDEVEQEIENAEQAGGTPSELLDEEGQTDDEPAIYKCNICSKPYKKPKAYQRHMEEVHQSAPPDLPQLDCNQCGLEFRTVAQLHTHYRSHLPAKDKRDNSCPHCDRKFTTPGTLKRHVEGVHKQIKPYACDLCGKGFKYITGLKDHKLVHTDDCPFECPVCQRRFKNKARLKIHSDTHSANIYECGECGLKLKTRRTLNKHKLVHSDERQYKCDVCGSTFKRSKTLKSHLILHTGIRPYKCNFCGRDFSNGSNCRSHKRQTHPKELAEEEARGVSRSTLLPMLDELTKAQLIKTPTKPCKPRTRTTKVPAKKSTPETSAKDADGSILYELVEELAYS